MNTESSVPKCPQCGAGIPADAPQGLCPRCVLLGAATTTEAGKPAARTELPSPEALRAAFPQLEIVELIGRGGMGFVYKARQAKLDRFVALKLLPVELGADPHFAERFHREARALARLNHPSIVGVYDFGVSAGFCYLLMEFVDGVNLRQAMQAGRFSQQEALTLVPKICEAIQFAHEQGVLHRDIKPENILLDSQGRVKIADFGIAKLVGEDTPDLTLTLSGARLGTPAYMAPEQIEKPGQVDHRADIYSLGVVFYELLTGELPLGRFAPPSAKTELDARVDDIVLRALAKERELRQQSAGEVKSQVETVAANPPPVCPRASETDPATHYGGWSSNYEYRSPRTLFGMPLVHVAYGRDPVTGKWKVARGIVALGHHAVGVIAIGGIARGLVALGGVALGGLAFGGLGVGILAFAGMAFGLVSVGGFSFGLLFAFGGLAMGLNAAGGLAIGKAAAGGLGLGKHVWDSRQHDEAARWLMGILRARELQMGLILFSLLAGLLPGLAAVWAARRHAKPATARPAFRAYWAIWLVAGIILLTIGAPFAVYMGRLVAPTQVMVEDFAPETLPLDPLAPAATPPLNLPAPPTDPNAQATYLTRTFTLRHALSQILVGDVQQILLGQPGREVRVGRDSSELVVTASSEEMARVAALVAVTDCPEQRLSLKDHTFTSEESMELARAFFYACAIQDYESVERALSLRELSVLAGKVRGLETDIGDVATARSLQLREAWPDKDATLRAFTAAWTRYPLRRLTLEPGISMGFGVRRHVNATFEGTPEDLVSLALLEEGIQETDGKRLLRVDTQPPWWTREQPSRTAVSPSPDSVETRQKQDIQINLARQRLEEARKQSAVGVISPLAVAEAERDLAVAEARGDAVGIAQARLTYSSLELLEAKNKFEHGALALGTLRGIEATNQILQIELTQALKATPQSPGAGGGTASADSVNEQITTVQLNLAKQSLAELRKQVEVGLVAPQGREVLGAELVVTTLEAQLNHDPLAEAVARRDHADKVFNIVQRMHQVGKAGKTEVLEVAANLATASATLASTCEKLTTAHTNQAGSFVGRMVGAPVAVDPLQVRYFSDEGTAAEPKYFLRFRPVGEGFPALLERQGFKESDWVFTRADGPAWWRGAPEKGLVSYARETKPAGCVVEALWWSHTTGDVYYFRHCP